MGKYINEKIFKLIKTRKYKKKERRRKYFENKNKVLIGKVKVTCMIKFNIYIHILIYSILFITNLSLIPVKYKLSHTKAIWVKIR